MRDKCSADMYVCIVYILYRINIYLHSSAAAQGLGKSLGRPFILVALNLYSGRTCAALFEMFGKEEKVERELQAEM